MHPICRPFYAAMWRPISAREHSPRPSPRHFAVLRFFRAHSPSALRGRRNSCSRQALAPDEPRLHSRHRRPRRHRQMEHKGGDTSSLAQCHPNTRDTLVKALRARESRDRVILLRLHIILFIISFFYNLLYRFLKTFYIKFNYRFYTFYLSS